MTRVIATALTALLLSTGVATSAMAQSFDFGIVFGDERRDFFPERITCLTDYQIRQAVADQGFTNIYLNVPNDKHVEVRATRDGWVYLLDFNYCRGRIESGRPLRRAN